jgi:dihydropyrimidinase
MGKTTCIENARIVTQEEVFSGHIAFESGKITSIGSSDNLPYADTTIDAEQNLVLPGIVDPHVHIDEVPGSRAGSYRTDTAAAALGGVTTIIDFAWQGGDRSLSNKNGELMEGISHKLNKAEQSHVDFGLHGALLYENDETLNDVESAIEAGVTSFKMFRSTYDVGVSKGFIHRAFERIAEHNAVAVLHTEEPSICETAAASLQRNNNSEAKYYPSSRPILAEAMSIDNACQMAIESGVKYYGVHTTSDEAATILDRYQKDRSQIRAETCTHYTIYDRSIHEELGNLPIIAPPLRTEEDREALFKHLERGTLSVISTDHITFQKKDKNAKSWWNSEYGVNSLQYTFPILHDELVIRRGYSYPYLMSLVSTNPAKTFGLSTKGTLQPGKDADIIIFNPDASQTIKAENNASNSDYSIYNGRKIVGRVEDTFLRGERIASNGRLLGVPGDGEFINREIPNWGPMD